MSDLQTANDERVRQAYLACARINREMAGVIGALPGSSIHAALEACAEKMDEIALAPRTGGGA